MDNLRSNQVNLTSSNNTKRLMILIYKVNNYSNRDSMFLHQCKGLPICRSRTINGMYLRQHKKVQRQACMEPQTSRSLTTSGRHQHQHQHRPVKPTINISKMYTYHLQASSHNGSRVATKLKIHKVRMRNNSMFPPQNKTYKLQGHLLERTLHLQTCTPSLAHKVSPFHPSAIVRA
jgi:hypothetical protein